MYSLKNNKIPKLHLKLNGYKLEFKSDKCIEYKKTIVSKDEYNYGMFYFIHVYYYPQDGEQDAWSNVCVSLKQYNRDWEDWGYDWYSGKYAERSIPIIARYDKKLLKYIEHVDG